MSTRAATIEAIENSMESVLLSKAKASVEITMMGENTWSICGKPIQAEKAMAFLGKSNLAEEYGRSSFAGELFIYFRTGA